MCVPCVPVEGAMGFGASHQVAGGVRGILAELQHPKINSKGAGGTLAAL